MISGVSETAALIALRSGGADALFGALVVVALLALARKAIRLAAEPERDERDRPPASPS